MKGMLRPFDGPLAPSEQEAALTRALNVYDKLDALIGRALAAPPAERLRLAARLVNGCGQLDELLEAAGVASIADGPRPPSALKWTGRRNIR